MALSAYADSSAPPCHDNTENNLQPFHVLHRRSKTKEKIGLSQNMTSPMSASAAGPKLQQDCDDDHLHFLRIDAFNFVWSKIETTIEDVLRNNNTSIFSDLNAWIHESFKVIRLCGEPGFVGATRPYPVLTDALFKQLFTGLVYTKNMEFVDDQLTFEDLGVHLRSHGCHVANLSSLDFSAKNGIGGCLSRMLRQFLTVTPDAADMSVLASWYYAQREYKPVVIIIEDMERCCGSLLSDFIVMLSEWVVKIPVVLVMGVATTLDAPSKILSSHALQLLCASKFCLGSPVQRMDAIIQAVLVRPCLWFTVGHKVALFMRDYFLKHDGTLTSFIRALKIACVQHFSTEPLSFLLKDLDTADDFQHIWSENHAFEQDLVLKHFYQLPSCRRIGEPTSENLVRALADLEIFHRRWAMVVMCLHEAGKPHKIPLLDLYCEALNPDQHRTSRDQGISSPSNCRFSGHHAASANRNSISQAVRKVRDLSPAALYELLKSWEAFAGDISEIRNKVKELVSLVKFVDDKSSGYDLASLRHSSRGVSAAKDPKLWNEKAVTLIEWMLRDHMKPIELLPFHELFCFKNVDKLQTALLGDPRKRIQADLLEFRRYVCCSCCSSSDRENSLPTSLHDTSIMYNLAQEHGDLINVYDWYQSFKLTVTHRPAKVRNKSKHCPSPKNMKDIDRSHGYCEAAIQARFCRAVSELQITGLLRIPSKRRPDYVQRVAFGL